jgi:hypothetical protein
MSKISLSGNPSGTATFTIESPATNTDRTINLPDAGGDMVLTTATQTLTNKTIQSSTVQGGTITLATAVTASGTSVDFTSIPSWVKRITVMFNGVSWNNTVSPLIQLGDSGGVETTGYSSIAGFISTASGAGALGGTTGFVFAANWTADVLFSGALILNLLDVSTNTWVAQGVFYADSTGTDYAISIAGTKALSATLDRVRVTSSAAITFDAGTINIIYEG